jgi:hypothetical protein
MKLAQRLAIGVPILASVVVLGTLMGCSTPAALAPVSRADIAAIEVSVTEAERVAKICLDQTVGPCTVPGTRLVIIRDAHAAHDAFKRLQVASAAGAPAAMVAVQEALRLLTAETPAVSAN